MKSGSSDGFSLVELAIALLLMGLVLSFSVPALHGFVSSYRLHGAAADITHRLSAAREQAKASGKPRTVRFMSGFQGSDYHVWNGSSAHPKWKLPAHIGYDWAPGTGATYRMSPDGRCLDSGMIILEDWRGKRDTIVVRSSGAISSP